jgi:hypothetical protein
VSQAEVSLDQLELSELLELVDSRDAELQELSVQLESVDPVDCVWSEVELDELSV